VVAAKADVGNPSQGRLHHTFPPGSVTTLSITLT